MTYINHNDLWIPTHCGMVKDGIIYPPSSAQRHVFCQTESNISNPQNNFNLKQLDRDDRNVCQPSRALCPLPYSSVDLQHIYNGRLVHLQHLLHLAVWLQQHLANTTRITSCAIVFKIQAVETKKTIRRWRLLSTVYPVRREWCPWPSHELDPESQNQVRLTTSNQDLRIWPLATRTWEFSLSSANITIAFCARGPCLLKNLTLRIQLDPKWYLIPLTQLVLPGPVVAVAVTSWQFARVKKDENKCEAGSHGAPWVPASRFFIFFIFIFFFKVSPVLCRLKLFLSSVSHFLWQSTNKCVRGSRLSPLVSIPLYLSFDRLEFWAYCWYNNLL